MLSKKEQLESDNKFREYCKIYYNETSSEAEQDNAWSKMFLLVQEASAAAVKSRLKNIYRADIDEVILDTALSVMAMLKKKKAKGEEFILQNKLVSLCGPYSLGPLYSKQQRFEDSVEYLYDTLNNQNHTIKIF